MSSASERPSLGTNELHMAFSCNGHGAEAYVVLDTLTGGTSSGGVRISEDITLEEVKALAREMTLKNSFWGLPKGGARSGIRIPPLTSPQERERILLAFGTRLAPLMNRGIYLPWLDLNCGPEELRTIYRGAGMELNRPSNTAFFTAQSVAHALAVCSELLGGTRKLTLAVEGFGAVAHALAALLPEDLFSICALSTSKGALLSAGGFSPALLRSSRERYGGRLVEHLSGGRRIEREELLEAEVDLLLPSARTWVINEKNVERIRARCIVPIANAPCTAGAVEQLHRRGVLCLPGFVTNAGGVFASSLYDSGVPLERIEELSATQYRRIVALLVERAAKLNVSPVLLAETVALRRGAAGERSAYGKGRRALKSAFRRGLIPRGLYGKAAAREWDKNLERLARTIAAEEEAGTTPA